MPKSQRDLDQSRTRTSETASQRERLDVYRKDRATRDREWSAASAAQAKAADVGPGKKAQLAGKSNLAGKGGPQAQRLKSPADLEEAHPYTGKKFLEPEPQEARGAPGSRESQGETQRPREKATAAAHTGVGRQEPIDDNMPFLTSGDQGG